MHFETYDKVRPTVTVRSQHIRILTTMTFQQLLFIILLLSIIFPLHMMFLHLSIAILGDRALLLLVYFHSTREGSHCILLGSSNLTV